LPLLDTPDTMPEAPNKGSNRKAQPAGLGNQVMTLLPTPPANAATGAGTQGRDGGPNLQTAVQTMTD